ncbi:hypothetical protein A8990_10344 [Paenibacillus taihuensis]|uniref:Uncharacterized protein n=1 Tax=Paenibacillus taihuensis TaxID=1156355 RepID=A0A3D9SD08_9BACL|nr:hypothetical protein A8990_10344 [Paenibacillus taihuensis]
MMVTCRGFAMLLSARDQVYTCSKIFGGRRMIL